MVEGSQIDWAAHGNDAEGLYRQMAWFDDTVKAALAYAKKKGDVLVVVTADHETGGVTVEGSTASSLKLAFTTKGHTDTRVPVFAYGPGSKAFAGPHDNTEVPQLIAKALGLSF
jgi:alkaline phosphatase